MLFVPPADSVKVFRLQLTNRSSEARRISITLYVDWVLGENRTRAAAHVVTSREPETGALLARNAFRQTFAERVAFLDLSPGDGRSTTADRTEFLGRNGTLARPAALGQRALSGRAGAGLDPCGAVQVHLVARADQRRAIVVGLLGEAPGVDEARGLVQRYRDLATVDAALADARGFWDRLLGTVVVQTPDRALDLLLNRWLLYQTLACRVWGRSAFYQSAAPTASATSCRTCWPCVHARPAAGARAHSARRVAPVRRRRRAALVAPNRPAAACARASPTTSCGCRYVTVPLRRRHRRPRGARRARCRSSRAARSSPTSTKSTSRPRSRAHVGTLYEHCVRALACGSTLGAHGLPLMGTGDWNDGMNLVGAAGPGRERLARLVPGLDAARLRRRGRTSAASTTRAARLPRPRRPRCSSASRHAWDGDWYRRAYFDDGTPLGSRENDECRIDAIAQSWAVIAGGGDPERARAGDGVGRTAAGAAARTA